MYLNVDSETKGASMSSPIDANSSVVPRENLIDTAVRFLTNPNVVSRPLQHKQRFLRDKGLTDEEIRISCERANAYVNTSPPSSSVQIYPQNAIVSQPNIFTRLRDILHTIALLGGVGYALYWVYKTYVEPFLFGRKPKKSAEESLSALEKAVEDVNRNTAEFRTEMKSELSRISQERDIGTSRNLADLKSDIATVKGLLLSRQQFPSAPNTSGLRGSASTKPSIPAWQMSGEDQVTENDKEVQSQDRDSHTEEYSEDSRSGSAPPNGSDSSLEMIHE